MRAKAVRLTVNEFKTHKGAPPGWNPATIRSPDDNLLPVHKTFTDIKKTALSIVVVDHPPPGLYEPTYYPIDKSFAPRPQVHAAKPAHE